MRLAYYIPFIPEADINYNFLFSLMNLANYRIETKSFDCIKYNTLAELADKLSISYATLNRYLKCSNYNSFMSIDKINKRIILNCHFANNKYNPFVRLTHKEFEYLKLKQDNLLIKYYLYLKYYCRKGGGSSDFTTKQFLSAIGYCKESKSYQGKISYYNSLLVSDLFLNIQKIRDILGHERNIYSIN